jgi:hypothetical protein
MSFLVGGQKRRYDGIDATGEEKKVKINLD